jgi:NAD+ kinase
MRFGFLLKRDHPQAARVARELAQELATKGMRVVVTEEDAAALPEARAVPAAGLGPAIDVLVVLGGDGTFLGGASLVAEHGVPLLGINLGSLGFITHYALADASAAVAAAAEGRLPIDERMRIDVALHAGDSPVALESRSGLNEVVVTQRGIARLLDLEASFDGEGVTTYKADGLIVSTPTGSTAYNLAAGGPILTPDLEAMVLTPICPHTLTNRPVVMRADTRIQVRNVSTSPVSVTVDGQWSRDLPPGDAVEIRRAERPVRTFRSGSPFFATLRQKLSWGERQV